MSDFSSSRQAFLQDVVSGLTQSPKSLPSKYFYDELGDKLFQKIMGLEEYYLTRKEFEILEKQHASIMAGVLSKTKSFNLVELGAGDGLKTKILLRYLKRKSDVDFTYFPVDFSGSALEELQINLEHELPGIQVKGIQNTYRGSLKIKPWENGLPNLILFLGSNIGNFTLAEAKDVLTHLSESCKSGDWVLLGIDLKKDPAIILRAYNDQKGVTRDFNLNLLKRINNELGANFILDEFIHWPTYDPVTGECRSYLVTRTPQKVTFPDAGISVNLEAFEPIWTEVSRKSSPEEIENLADEFGFRVCDIFTDSEDYFANVLWEKV